MGTFRKGEKDTIIINKGSKEICLLKEVILNKGAKNIYDTLLNVLENIQ